jgi:hypothetical protein
LKSRLVLVVPLLFFVGACGSVTNKTGTGGSGGGAGTTSTGGTAGSVGAGGTAATGGTSDGGGMSGAAGTVEGAAGMAGGAGGAPAGTGGAGANGSGGMASGSGSGGSAGGTGSPATGGASGAAGISGSAGAGGGPASCGNLIDDMESGDGRICMGSGRMGYWYTYIDSATGSSISPLPTTKPATPSATSPTRGDSHWAMHASGTFSSYAGVGCVLDATLGSPPHSYNAAGFTGVHFWAHASAGMKLVLQASGDETTGNGGTCTTTCYGSDYTLPGLSSTAWTEYSVPFTSVTGGTVPLMPSDLWSVEFGPVSPGPFDMWIDDLSLY